MTNTNITVCLELGFIAAFKQGIESLDTAGKLLVRLVAEDPKAKERLIEKYRKPPRSDEARRKYNREYERANEEKRKLQRLANPRYQESWKRDRLKYKPPKRVPRMLRILLAASSLARESAP